MSLEQLQDAFIRGVYSGELVEADTLIQSNEKLSPAQQFEIYMGSVNGNLVAALGDIFPRVKVALGATFFDALSRRYIKQNPSRSWSLDHYGSHFAQFCRNFEPLAAYPYIPDLASADWAWHCAFHCLDVQAVDASRLQTTMATSANVRFALHPSAVIIDSDYPVFQLWHFNERAREGRNEDGFELDQSAECMLIWRAGLNVETKSLDSVDAYLFKAFGQEQGQGQTLQQAFESALKECEKLDDFEAEQLSASLSSLINLGLLCEAGNSSNLKQSK